jgi:hypothetical protein
MDAQAECVPMMASFAAAQDWDGVWFYTYSHSGDSWNREILYSYFDIDTNPAKWGFMRAGAAVFRAAAVAPLSPTSAVLVADLRNNLSDLAELHMQHDRDMFTVLKEAGNVTRADMLKGVHIPSYTASNVAALGYEPSTTALTWSVESGNGSSKGLYRVVSSDAQVYAGHAARFEKTTNGDVRISSPEFVVLTVTPLDSSEKILVTACGRCENSGMQFSQDRRTVGRNWGQAPVQIETVDGQFVLPKGRWTCHALAPDGSVRQRVPMDGNVLKLSPEYETMWYLLERQAK